VNIHEDLSDNEVLRTASDSLAGMPVAAAPDVAEIMARSRARRRRRISAAAGLSAVAAVTALALSLTGTFGQARTPGVIRTAAFTLVSNSDGTATLTINPKELLDPAALQNDFAQYGIPAKVTSGSFCTSDPAPAGFSQVVSGLPGGPSTATPTAVPQPALTIDPAAIPAGTELSLGYFQLTSGPNAGEQQADFVLINTNSYTCTTTAPDPNSLPAGYGPSDGLGLLYGGPGPAGS
jgi:hypothetical protein